jgi:alpha,alpha-trehalase
MNRFFWDEKTGYFFDYDLQAGQRSGYGSTTSLFALWAGWATPAQAARAIAYARANLEQKAGLASTSEASRGPLGPDRPPRQWDFPYGWAPHQILAWEGLENYGFRGDAERLAYKWVYTLTRNAADYNGTVPEKIDVVTGSHAVFAEYGNVGTNFAYITREGFGWMNASYQLGLHKLSPQLLDRLRAMTPPEAALP